MRTFFIRLILVCVVLLLLIAGGFALFVSRVSQRPVDLESRTDAIVALTGGTVRLNESIRLLVSGMADKLFITGIGQGADLESLLMLSGPLPDGVSIVLPRIELGYEAGNTEGNAIETAQWMQRNGYRTIRLVTANYHMPRSLEAFRSVMPDATIIGHPIVPENVRVEEWWGYRGTFSLLFTEYLKLLAFHLSHLSVPVL